MKNDLLWKGMLFLGTSLIICSLIISYAILKQTEIYGTLNGNLNGSLSGSFTMEDNANEKVSSDILVPYQAGELLGYNDYNWLIIDIEEGRLEGIPYTRLGSNYVFSKKALEEWIYNKATNGQ